MTSQQMKTFHLMCRVVAILDKTGYYTDETVVKQEIKKMLGLNSIKEMNKEYFDLTMASFDLYLLENGTTIDEIERHAPNIFEK